MRGTCKFWIGQLKIQKSSSSKITRLHTSWRFKPWTLSMAMEAKSRILRVQITRITRWWSNRTGISLIMKPSWKTDKNLGLKRAAWIWSPSISRLCRRSLEKLLRTTTSKWWHNSWETITWISPQTLAVSQCLIPKEIQIRAPVSKTISILASKTQPRSLWCFSNLRKTTIIKAPRLWARAPEVRR